MQELLGIKALNCRRQRVAYTILRHHTIIIQHCDTICVLLKGYSEADIVHPMKAYRRNRYIAPLILKPDAGLC